MGYHLVIVSLEHIKTGGEGMCGLLREMEFWRCAVDPVLDKRQPTDEVAFDVCVVSGDRTPCIFLEYGSLDRGDIGDAGVGACSLGVVWFCEQADQHKVCIGAAEQGLAFLGGVLGGVGAVAITKREVSRGDRSVTGVPIGGG